MKRISWNLPVFSLSDFKFYKTSDKIKRGQTPITVTLPTEKLPENDSYFIGTTGSDTKLLCYHMSGGKYIVVSYNRNTEIIFKDIIDIYNKDDNDVNKGININTGSDLNPTVSIINPDGTVGEQDE